MKIGVIKEGKVPPDERVPLTPDQCKKLVDRFENLEIVVQKSPIRAIKETDYLSAGINMADEVADCDVLIGVKEVPINHLIPDKTYFFFSHTIKEQPYNRKLLQAVIEKNIRLVDYETLTNEKSVRLVGFGRYAGIVGAYNGLRAYGKKSGSFDLKPAHDCADRKELEHELSKVKLPANFKIVITGLGRVAKGAIEIFNSTGIKKVGVNEFLNNNFDSAVFTQLNVTDYNERLDGKSFKRFDFYRNPKDYRSTFPRFLKVADMYVTCHFWDAHAPFIFTREDLNQPGIKTKIVADISCDIAGPIPCTIRPSTIDDPLYGYAPATGKEIDFYAENAIGVMAVDNLPCELPKDASADFGNELVEKVLPHLLTGDKEGVIAGATIAENGALTAKFSYLQNYLDGKSN